MTALERFWEKVEKTESCWLWRASKFPGGYGQFSYPSGQYAHRFAYEALVGPIPDGLQIDHLCRNPACVNPEHMEPVTSRENTMRGNAPSAFHARKTHCIHGHEFTPANTYVHSSGTRHCRSCRQRRLREWRRRTSTYGKSSA